MVFAEDDMLQEKIRLMRSHGMSAPTLDRHLGRAKTYDVVSHGLNYRPDEIRAAIGRVQLKKLDAGNERRRQLAHRYTHNLASAGLLVPFSNSPSNINSSHHIFPLILPKTTNRFAVMEDMKASGIQTSIHYPSFKSFSAYVEATSDLETPVADKICERELTLPLHPRMSIDDVDYVSKSLIGMI